jgi:hypothetical protein
VTYFDYEECLRYLDYYCNQEEISGFSALGDGEKYSIALSLYLNARFARPIILLTDDFGAINILGKIISEQKFAIQMSVPDVIISLLKTDTDFDENLITGALQTYYNIRRGQAMINEIFRKRMRTACCNAWPEKCRLNCISYS